MTTWAAHSTHGARRGGGDRRPCAGDRGLPKSPPSEALAPAGWPDLPALTTPPGERVRTAKGLALALGTAPGWAVAPQAPQLAGSAPPRLRLPIDAWLTGARAGRT
jgi:hypothetical protein